jgi:hypothetical protein
MYCAILHFQIPATEIKLQNYRTQNTKRNTIRCYCVLLAAIIFEIY